MINIKNKLKKISFKLFQEEGVVTKIKINKVVILFLFALFILVFMFLNQTFSEEKKTFLFSAIIFYFLCCMLVVLKIVVTQYKIRIKGLDFDKYFLCQRYKAIDKENTEFLGWNEEGLLFKKTRLKFFVKKEEIQKIYADENEIMYVFFKNIKDPLIILENKLEMKEKFIASFNEIITYVDTQNVTDFEGVSKKDIYLVYVYNIALLFVIILFFVHLSRAIF